MLVNSLSLCLIRNMAIELEKRKAHREVECDAPFLFISIHLINLLD